MMLTLSRVVTGCHVDLVTTFAAETLGIQGCHETTDRGGLFIRIGLFSPCSDGYTPVLRDGPMGGQKPSNGAAKVVTK